MKRKIKSCYSIEASSLNSFRRRLSVFFIAAICLFTAAAPSASALSTTLYGGANPSPGYLNERDSSGKFIHLLTGGPGFEGGVSADIFATTPAEYCNYYNTGSQLAHQNGYNQSSFTGFDTGQSYINWQQGDASSSNVCQAKGGTWGFKVSGASNNNCSPNLACGMQHFVRLSDGQAIRPWGTSNSAGPASALTFNVSVKPQIANYSQGAFGYFCPLLQETGTVHFIEYCFMEWQKGSGFPAIADYDRLGACADTTPGGYNVDTVFTTFKPYLAWSTKRPGSADIISTVPTANYVNQTASISVQSLRSVIDRINNNVTGAPHGCNRGLSTDVSKYALVGFEHGLEGGGFSMLGGSVTNERIYKTTDILYAGDTLGPNQTMYASDSGAKVTMQGDGNLVVRDANGALVWNSYTFGYPGARLVMQPDGNLVVYDVNNIPRWTSQRFGSGGAYAVVQGDGNFVEYQGSTPIWSVR